MKLSELKAAVDKYYDRAQKQGDDPEVLIETVQPGVPIRHKIGIKCVILGSDWTSRMFVIYPQEPMVQLNTKNKSIQDIAKEDLAYMKDCYSRAGQEYIKKAREIDWIEGFERGFGRFSITTFGTGTDNENS